MTNAPRVRVAHPRTDASRPGPRRPVAWEIGEQTRVGDVYMASLMRVQRRLAVTVCATVTLLLVGIAIAGAYAPQFVRIKVLGIALPWLVLGLLIYPVLIALAWFTIRATERAEHDFLDLVRRR